MIHGWAEIHSSFNGHSTLRTMSVNGEKVSFLGVADHRISIGTAELCSGGIGGVSTEEKHLYKGYMRHLMQSTVEYMAESYDVSLLYGIKNFYDKFGYAVCLFQNRFILKPENFANLAPCRPLALRAVQPEDWAEIVSLYNSESGTRTLTLNRRKELFYGFGKGSRLGVVCESFMLLNEDGTTAGYLAADLLDDECNIIEVQLKDRNQIRPLLASILQLFFSKKASQICFHLPEDHFAAQWIRRLGCTQESDYPHNCMGMGRIVNLMSFFSKMTGELERRLQQRVLPSKSARFAVITDIGSVTLNISPESVTVSPGSAEPTHELHIKQSELFQLMTGYRTYGDIVLDNSECSCTSDEFCSLLTPDSKPYFWCSDYF